MSQVSWNTSETKRAHDSENKYVLVWYALVAEFISYPLKKLYTGAMEISNFACIVAFFVYLHKKNVKIATDKYCWAL